MAVKRNGWTRLRGGTGGVWRHDASGMVVKHCGHPTALWPYYGQPQKGGPLLIAHNGLAFGKLVYAQAAVEALVADGARLAEFLALEEGHYLDTESRLGCDRGRVV